MIKYKAIAPKEGKIASYLTNGKEYPITEIHGSESEIYGRYFHFMNDNNTDCYSSEKRSSHLYDLDWTIKEINEKPYHLICTTYSKEYTFKSGWDEKITTDEDLIDFLKSWNISLDFPYLSKNSVSKVLSGNNENNTEIINVRIVRFD